VLLTKVVPSSLRTKSPPKKCLTDPPVGLSGVDASGSTMATTKGPFPISAGTGARRRNAGGRSIAIFGMKLVLLLDAVQGRTYHSSEASHRLFER